MTDTFCLIKFSRNSQDYSVARVQHEGKRYAWVEYPNGMVVREPRRRTSWRFDSCEDARAMLSKLEAERANRCLS